MMELLLYILPILFIHLFGFFDACQTARKDYAYTDNAIWNWIQSKELKYTYWYQGGNSIYPPGNPFKCDFWHFMKHCWTFCISGCALSIILVTLIYPSYFLILYGFLYGVEGLSFTFYYSYVLRTDRNFKWYIKSFATWGWKTQN